MRTEQGRGPPRDRGPTKVKTKEKGDGKIKGRKPDYIAATVAESGNGQPDRWTDLGVAFHNKDTDSYTVQLDAVPINGKLVLYKPKRWKDGEPPTVERN